LKRPMIVGAPSGGPGFVGVLKEKSHVVKKLRAPPVKLNTLCKFIYFC